MLIQYLCYILMSKKLFIHVCVFSDYDSNNKETITPRFKKKLKFLTFFCWIIEFVCMRVYMLGTMKVNKALMLNINDKDDCNTILIQCEKKNELHKLKHASSFLKM